MMDAQHDTARGEGRRIVLVSNTSWYLHNFRGEMIRRLAESGWEVHTAAPDDAYRRELEESGARFVLWRLDRRSLSPFSNVRAFFAILSVYRRIRPDVVHHFTIKPVTLGGIAARLLRVRGIVQSVTGLGHAFAGPAPLRLVALSLYHIALGGRAVTIFQNLDDMQTIIETGVTVRRRCRLIRGSGVDPTRFSELPPPPDDGPVTYLMASRMLWAKGVREFVEAASRVREQIPATRFLLVGDPDGGSPDAVPRTWLERLVEKSPVEWRPFVRDIRPVLAESHVVVLPSYREGLSRSLLEGAAAGRPLISTDAPGCRDVAIAGVTGLTVPVGDPGALADAMIALATDRHAARSMGARGRELVADRYSLDRVITRTLEAYEAALDPTRDDDALRVLHIITGLGIGGAEQMLTRLLEYGHADRTRPVVVSLRDRGDLGDRIRALGIPLYELGMSPGRPSLAALLRLRAIIRREAPHVIQTWMYHADLAGGLAAKLAGGVPVAWGIRHSTHDAGRTKPSSLRVVRLCAKLSRTLPTAIVTNSEAARTVHGEIGYDASRITVIPNGFDISRYRPDPEARGWLRDELGIPEDAIVITSAGRYHPVKDHAGLLAAAALLDPTHRDDVHVHFVLCGEGVTPAATELAHIAASDALAGHVHLLGRRDDLERVFAATDIFTSSSAFGEAFPQVVGEAMSCGTPCVVTDVGDSASIVGDTGRVVPPEDPPAMAAAWEELIAAGSDHRAELSARARARVVENYEIGHIVEMFEAFHMRVAGRDAGDPCP